MKCSLAFSAAFAGLVSCPVMMIAGERAQLADDIHAIREAVVEGDPIARSMQRRDAAFDMEIALVRALDMAEQLKEERQEKREAAREDAREKRLWPNELDRLLARLNKDRVEAGFPPIAQATERPVEHSGSGGRIIKGGKAVDVPPTPVGGLVMAPTPRGEPPAGAVWVFPEPSKQRWVWAYSEDKLTDAEWNEAGRVSHSRALARYPFLADKQDARRQQLDEFVMKTRDDKRYDALYSLSGWREYVADECALTFGWEKAGGGR